MDNDQSQSMRDYVPQGDLTEDVESASQDTPTPTVADGSVQAPVQTPQEKTVESFTTNFDPNKLPPELLPAYKQMQGDYTRKTQEIASIREKADTYGRYEGLINFLAQNPTLLEKALGEQEQQPQEQVVEYPDDPAEFARKVREETKAELMEEFEKRLAERDSQRALETRLDQEISQAEKLDPRLVSDEKFARFVANAVHADPEVEMGRKSIIQSTKEAIDSYDSYFNERLEAEKAKLSDMARAKRSPIAQGSNAPTASAGVEINSMRDAARAAGLLD